MKRFFLFSLILFLLLSASASAATARGIDSEESARYHFSHLNLHLENTDLRCTGNYVKVRAQPENGRVLGHLEQADTFALRSLENGWARIQVFSSHETSPDSYIGLTGWVDARFLDCSCTQEAYLQGTADDFWQDAYLSYLHSDEFLAPYLENFEYSLIFVDADNIPELAISTGVEAGGCIILTFHDGVVDALQTARLHFTYLERGNLLNNCDGHMDYYYDYLYTIQNGRWVRLAAGSYNGYTGLEDETYQRYICQEYFWNDIPTTREDYMAALLSLYPLKQASSVRFGISFQMISSYLGQ